MTTSTAAEDSNDPPRLRGYSPDLGISPSAISTASAPLSEIGFRNPEY